MTAPRPLAATAALPALLLSAVLAACGGAQAADDPPSFAAGPTSPAPTDPAVAPTAPTDPAVGPAAPDVALAPAGRACGGRGLAPCEPGEYCDFPDGSACGAGDGGGVCRPRPTRCTREYRPICGCDGRTHPTRCSAAADGVDTAAEGPCATTPPERDTLSPPS